MAGDTMAWPVVRNPVGVVAALLLTSFFRPGGRRRRILTDAPLFPSDRHALVSHLASRGLDPTMDLIAVGPRGGDVTVRTSDLEAAIGAVSPGKITVPRSGRTGIV